MLEDVPLLHLAILLLVAMGAAGAQMWLALWCVKRWDEVQRRGPRSRSLLAPWQRRWDRARAWWVLIDNRKPEIVSVYRDHALRYHLWEIDRAIYGGSQGDDGMEMDMGLEPLDYRDVGPRPKMDQLPVTVAPPGANSRPILANSRPIAGATECDDHGTSKP